MSEKCVVRLADVADKLEEVTDHWEQFLNIRSGEFVALADGGMWIKMKLLLMRLIAQMIM